MTRIGLASLRMGDPRRVMQIARAGGPSRTNDDLHVWCPLCGCPMSGCAFTPNRVAESCDANACWCHAEQDDE